MSPSPSNRTFFVPHITSQLTLNNKNKFVYLKSQRDDSKSSSFQCQGCINQGYSFKFKIKYSNNTHSNLAKIKMSLFSSLAACWPWPIPLLNTALLRTVPPSYPTRSSWASRMAWTASVWTTSVTMMTSRNPLPHASPPPVPRLQTFKKLLHIHSQ